MYDSRSLFLANLSCNLGKCNAQRLYGVSKGSLDFIQRLSIDRKLSVHNGCVNTVCWNDTGQYILSGSDDQHLAITNPFSGQNIATIHSGHRANIFAAKFLPCTQDRHVISCSGDGTIFFTEVDREDTYGQHKFDCHFGTTYEVLTVPHDPNTFLSCGEDGTVRWFDLRTKTSCTKEDCKDDVLLNCKRAVTALCVNPIIPYQLCVACADSSVRIFDRRMLGTRATGSYSAKGNTGLIARFTAPSLENRNHRVTSLQYSPDGEELLVSYSSELIYLFNMKEDGVKPKEFQKESPLICSASKMDPLEEPLPSTSRGDLVEGGRQPPVKRLRLRGDWSDTGPNARPERERGEEAPRSVTIMQRMSDMLSRWLEGANRTSERQEGGSSEENPGENLHAQVETAESENNDRSETIHQEAAGLSEIVPVASTSQHDSVQEESFRKTSSQADDKPNETLSEATGSSDYRSDNITSHPKDADVLENSGASGLSLTDPQKSQQTNENEAEETLNENTSGAKKERYTSETHSDVSASESGPLSAADVNVKSMKQTIQHTQIEPVISFQYNSEGTSASTISVDFQEMEGAKSLPSVSTAEGTCTSNMSTLTDSEANSKGFEKLSTIDLDDQTVRCQETPSEVSNTDVSERNKCETAVDPANNVAQESTHQEHGEVTVDKRESDGHDSDDSYEEFTDFDTASDDQTEDQEVANLGEDNLQNNPKLTAPEVTITAAPEPASDDTEAAATSQEGEKGSGTEAVDASVSDSSTPTRVTRPRAVTGVSSSGRQRRIGISGPPTGDFQLHSDSDEDDDSDSELMRAAERTRRSRDTMERNLAAMRLQELYRKRQEQREQEERESMNLKQPAVKQVYRGHRNARTMIKESNFWGEHYVMSGSDCGHIFIWDRYTGKLVMLLEGDRHVVNCVQPHPFYPVLASSGIDYDVKIWMPMAEEPSFDEAQAKEVMRRNEIMLEETRDTITVPASFMLRMLASLNNIQAGRRGNQQEDSSSSSEDDDGFANNLFNDDNNNDSNNNI